MSNFEFMKQQNILNDTPAFNKMYQYLLAAEKNYYLDSQMCGMNIRWALEQFCCVVSDLTDVKYDARPTYMGEFLSAENRFKLLMAVRGEVNYRAICEVNAISREYAHSIITPDADRYGEMLPKMYALVIWLYKVLLGAELNFTYSSFSYDKVPQDGDELFFVKKDDVVYTSREQVEYIKKKFPKCDTSMLYSIRKVDERIELLDERDNVVESYVNESFIVANEDLQSENENLTAVQEQLRRTIKTQEREKEALEEEVADLSFEIEEAERKILELEKNFQTQTEEYKVLLVLKNELVKEKKRLQELLSEADAKYRYLNATLREEILKYKEDKEHLQTLLSNAEAQVVYYKALVDKYTKEMNENTGLVLANVERFENGYQVYKRTHNEEEFRKVLLGIRFVIDGVRDEVKKEKFQRERDKADTDKKIKRVERMVKKKNTILVALIIILGALCIGMMTLVGYLIKSDDEESKQPVQIIINNSESQHISSTTKTTEESQSETRNTEFDAKSESDEAVENNIIEEQEEQGVSNPDDRLDEMYDEMEERNSRPRTLEEIENVSTIFLNEYSDFVAQYDEFYELARWGKEDAQYKLISKKMVPFFVDLNEFYEKRIYQVVGSEKIQYVYTRHSSRESTLMFGVAIKPESLSSKFSYETSKDEILKTFGEEYCKQDTYNMGYAIPEMEDTYGVLLMVRLDDCKIYILMDETGSKIVDYIYVLGQK